MLIAVGGAVLGTVIAVLVMHVLTAGGTLALPRTQDVGVDARVLAFSAALAVATGLAFGLVPALHVVRLGHRAHAPLGQGWRHSSGSGRARSVLVFTELALGTVLLVGAGLLIRSFQRLTNVDPGFRADHLVVFDVALSGNKYDLRRRRRTSSPIVCRRGSRRCLVCRAWRSRPTAHSTRNTSALRRRSRSMARRHPRRGTEPKSRLRPVSPDFFRTMGMSLVRGRTFTDDENRLDAVPVLVINQALADRYFPGQNPIGKHLTYAFWHGGSPRRQTALCIPAGEIIGVVRNAYYSSLKSTPEPATFLPYRRFPLGATFVLRTALPPAGLEQEIRRVVASVDPDVPMYELGTMNAALAESVSQSRFYTLLLTAFAAIALLLATLGVYGVVSYAVSQQTRDFGIRIALGADSRDVVNLVLGRGASLILPGLAAGILGALFLTRAIRGLLFGVEPLDRPTLALVCLVFAAVGAIASWLPARRAARVDPIIAMRSE